MRICNNCGKKFEGNEKFCDECGSATEELKRFCENCGAEMPFEALFCNNCGTKVGELSKTESIRSAGMSGAAALQTIKSTLTELFDSAAEFVKKSFFSIQKAASKHKVPKYVVPAVAIVLCVSILFWFVSSVVNSVKPSEKIYYFSGADVYSYDLKKEKMQTIEDGNYADVDGWHLIYLTAFTKLSENGDRIFYPRVRGDFNDGFSLYIQFVNKKNKEPIKIDSDVSSYETNASGTKVIYYKQTSSAYYINEVKNYKIGERQKIASDVSQMHYNSDFTSFLWQGNDEAWYLKKGKDDKVKIAGEEVDDAFVSNDLNFYYLQDGVLYCRPINKEKTKIDSDVIQFHAEDNGTLYYIKKGLTQHYSYDYIDDDLLATDAAITEPVEPDSDDYETWSEYWDAQDAYRDAYSEYTDKVTRDELRKYLKKEKDNSQWGMELYFYNGSNSKKLDENVINLDYYDSEKKNIVYSVCNFENAKFKFSDYWKDLSYYAARDEENNEFTASYTLDFNSYIEDNTQNYYSYHGGQSVAFDAPSHVETILFDTDGKMYYLDQEEGNLNVLSANKKETSGTIYATDVSTFTLLDDNRVLCKSEQNDDTGLCTLSIGNKVIDTDVQNVFMVDGDIHYYTDWNNDNNMGTLKKYQSNGKSVVIADDVNSFAKVGNKYVVLVDYSSYKGDLYYYKNKSKKMLIAEDVSSILDGYGGYYNYNALL